MSEPGADIERLYDAHATKLFAFVLNLTRSEADTKDILQQIFCNLARDPNIMPGLRNPGAFLAKMAYRLVIDQHRRREVRERHAADTDHVEVFVRSADPDEAAFRQALADAMATLPEEQRAVLHLKLWEDFTFEQIAEVLDIPANTAASRYRYGLDKLRSRLRPIYEEIL